MQGRVRSGLSAAPQLESEQNNACRRSGRTRERRPVEEQRCGRDGRRRHAYGEQTAATTRTALIGWGYGGLIRDHDPKVRECGMAKQSVSP